jgi:single-strand DNA-binding protein
MYLNKVQLIGNLTRDPEVRYTPKGSAVADIALAVNRVYTTDNGEKREEVTYIDVILWAKLAELAGQYLHKGAPVYLEGRLQLDSWDDKATGQKRSKLQVVGESMQFLGRKEGNEGGARPPERQSARPPQSRPSRASRQQHGSQSDQVDTDFGGGDIDGDDIPFAAPCSQKLAGY